MAKARSLWEALQRIGDEFDPRFDKRKLEQERLRNLELGVEKYGQDAPEVSIVDFEGKPYITTMSDRTAAGGYLTDINGVPLDRPVDLLGGQDYMFNNQDHVWASAKGPLNQILKLNKNLKADTGQDALLMPWRMAPSGSDFASMTGETMLTYARSNMGKDQRKALDASMRELIPDWKGIDNPSSLEQFEKSPDKVRKAVKQMLDRDYRNEGGLSIGEARLAIADPTQINAREGGLQNVGVIDSSKGIDVNPSHPSYPFFISGQPQGRLKEDIPVYMLDPQSLKMRQGKDQVRVVDDPMNPMQADFRALQMRPQGGIIDEAVLKRLQKAGIISSPSAVGAASLLDALQQDQAQQELDNLMGQYNEFMDRKPDIYNYGDFAPVKRNVVSGDYSLAVPTMVDDIVKGLLDIGQSRKTGVVNSGTSILDALL